MQLGGRDEGLYSELQVSYLIPFTFRDWDNRFGLELLLYTISTKFSFVHDLFAARTFMLKTRHVTLGSLRFVSLSQHIEFVSFETPIFLPSEPRCGAVDHMRHLESQDIWAGAGSSGTKSYETSQIAR